MLVRTLAIVCGCFLLVEATRSKPKKVEKDVEDIVWEGLRADNRQPCGLHFAGYAFKTYERELQREGTAYYVKVDVKYSKEPVNKDRELVVFKPKGKGMAKITKGAC